MNNSLRHQDDLHSLGAQNLTIMNIAAADCAFFVCAFVIFYDITYFIILVGVNILIRIIIERVVFTLHTNK